MKSFYTYGDLLRVPAAVVKQDRLRYQFLEYVSKNPRCFREAVFFICETHDIRNLEYLRDFAKKLVPMFAELRRYGIRVGVNVLSTLGHHQEIKDDSLDGMDFQIERNGEKNRGRLCPSSEKNLAFIGEVYSVFAALAPDIIYADDDVDYGVNTCQCPLCLKAFEQLYGHFGKRGLEVGQGSFAALWGANNEKMRSAFRRDWSDFTRRRTVRLLNVIEKSVHAASPATQLGFMSCITDKPKKSVSAYAAALSKGRAAKWRPGGGLYNDAKPMRVMKKANSIARQIKDLPPYVREIQSEIENFPYQAWKKSVRFTVFESLVYLLAGCTGTAFNVLSWLSGTPSLEEYFPYLDIAQKIRPFAEGFVRRFGRNEPVGVGSYSNEAMLLDCKDSGFSHVYEDELYQVGIPAAYRAENMRVCLLNGRLAESLTKREALRLLGGGVFLDADALDALNRMGLSEYTGFSVGKEYRKGVKERSISNFITGDTVAERHICPEFSINGHSEFEKTAPILSLIKTDEKAVWLTELTDYAGRTVDFASGAYENALGGRVCVGGFAPFSWEYSAARMHQLKNILRWLSFDTLPAYVASPAKIALWCRNAGNVRIAFANLSFDAAENFEIAVLGYAEELRCTLYCDGGEQTVPAKFVRGDGPYSIYSVSRIRPFGVGYLFSEK